MYLKSLEYFVAIVEKGGLSSAAKHLYVTQPSLSQFLAQLEKTENAQLFIKDKNNKMLLTEAGKLYYDSAKRILKIQKEYEKRLEDITDCERNCLSFGVRGKNGVDLASRIIKELSDKYPKKQITVHQETSTSILQDKVIDGEFDMAFSGYYSKHPGLCYIDFPVLEIVLVLPSDHEFVAMANHKENEPFARISLAGRTLDKLITLDSHTVLFNTVSKYIEENNISTSGGIVVHDVLPAYSMVEKGLGISLLPLASIPATPSSGLCYLTLDAPLYYDNVALYYSRSKYRSAFMKDFIKIATRIAKSEFPC